MCSHSVVEFVLLSLVIFRTEDPLNLPYSIPNDTSGMGVLAPPPDAAVTGEDGVDISQNAKEPVGEVNIAKCSQPMVEQRLPKAFIATVRPYVMCLCSNGNV